jgi:hypothetical protein
MIVVGSMPTATAVRWACRRAAPVEGLAGRADNSSAGRPLTPERDNIGALTANRGEIDCYTKPPGISEGAGDGPVRPSVIEQQRRAA